MVSGESVGASFLDTSGGVERGLQVDDTSEPTMAHTRPQHKHLPMTSFRQRLYQAKLKASGSKLGRGVFIAHGSRISSKFTLGDYSRINGPIRVSGIAPVTIGRYVAIAADVTILSSNHGSYSANIQVWLHGALALGELRTPEEVHIGNAVWLGDRVIVLPGVTVADGAIVGAGSVVTHDIPAFTVAVGVPARVLRPRFSEEIVAALTEIAWWEWDFAKVARNRDFLSADLTQISSANLVQLIRD